jgi:hypothetical protein
MLLTSQNTPHITHGNEQCLKLLLGVCNTKRRGDLSLSLINSNSIIAERRIANRKRFDAFLKFTQD